MSLTAIAFWCAYILGTLGALVSPAIGVALYVLVYHLSPETQWWGDEVRVLNLRTSFIVAVAAGIGMLLHWPKLRHGARQFPLPFALAIAFGALALATLWWGLGVTPRGAYLAEKFGKTLIILFIMIRCVRTPAEYHLVLYAWLLGVAYVGYQATGGAGITSSGRLTAGLGGPDFADSSGLAVHMVAALPLVGAAFFVARTWWGRAFALVAGALVVNTIVATRTRSALVGIPLMALTCVFSLPRGYRVKGIAAVVVGTLLALQLVDPGWWNRMQTLTQFQHDASATARLAIWKAAFEMASDYPLGIGLGNFHHTVMRYLPGLAEVRSAHNTIVACLAELGWPGLLVFLLILGLTLARLKRTQRLAETLPPFLSLRVLRRQTRFHLGWHALGLRSALVGYLACAFFTTRLFTEDLWLMIGLAMCLHNVSKHMIAEAHAKSTEPDNEAAGVPAGLRVPAIQT